MQVGPEILWFGEVKCRMVDEIIGLLEELRILISNDGISAEQRRQELLRSGLSRRQLRSYWINVLIDFFSYLISNLAKMVLGVYAKVPLPSGLGMVPEVSSSARVRASCARPLGRVREAGETMVGGRRLGWAVFPADWLISLTQSDTLQMYWWMKGEGDPNGCQD